MITVTNTINASIEKVWKFWTTPEHITKWNNASPDWHSPFAENDLTVEKRFRYTMAAKDGSMSFDFEGTYTNIEKYAVIEYILDDDRKVQISFEKTKNGTKIIESFDPENENTLELQKNGWQAILDNFKKYVEQ
ncbi:SRPBCC family protein [Flavobacterium sp.]|uniref:SRPBCC family protein n=1 Tax=Flavobacterium sp. TaxID=239 RepID=UPI0038FCB986